MNQYSRLFMLGPRGCGRTYATAEACRQIGATMLCRDSRHALKVSKDHQIKVAVISLRPEGLSGPFLADHNAMLKVCIEYEGEIQKLRNMLEELST